MHWAAAQILARSWIQLGYPVIHRATFHLCQAAASGRPQAKRGARAAAMLLLFRLQPAQANAPRIVPCWDADILRPGVRCQVWLCVTCCRLRSLLRLRGCVMLEGMLHA